MIPRPKTLCTGWEDAGTGPWKFSSRTRLEVLPQLTAPVASTGHLIGLKVLAGRNRDLTDLEALIPGAPAADLDVARSAVKLIQARGFNREQDVIADLEKLIADMRP